MAEKSSWNPGSETWKFKITQTATQTATSSTTIIWQVPENPSLLVRHCQQLAVPTGARLPYTDFLEWWSDMICSNWDPVPASADLSVAATDHSTTLSWVVISSLFPECKDFGIRSHQHKSVRMEDIWNCRVMRPSISCSTQVAMIMSQLTTLIWDSSSLDADAAVVESVSAAAVSSAAGTWRYSQIGPMILRMFQPWMDPFTSLPSKQNELLPTWPLWTRSATHVKEKSSMQSNDCFMLTSSPIPILQIFSAPQSTCGCNVTTSRYKIWSSHLCARSSSLPVDSYNLSHISIWHKTLEPLRWILDAGSPGSGCRGLDHMFIAHCNHCHEALNIVRQPNGGSFHYVFVSPHQIIEGHIFLDTDSVGALMKPCNYPLIKKSDKTSQKLTQKAWQYTPVMQALWFSKRTNFTNQALRSWRQKDLLVLWWCPPCWARQLPLQSWRLVVALRSYPPGPQCEPTRCFKKGS